MKSIYPNKDVSDGIIHNPKENVMLYSANGSRIHNRELFNTYLTRIESVGGNQANGDGWKYIEYEVVVTGEFPTPWGELPSESERVGSPVMVVDSYSDQQAAYRARNELESLVN